MSWFVPGVVNQLTLSQQFGISSQLSHILCSAYWEYRFLQLLCRFYLAAASVFSTAVSVFLAAELLWLLYRSEEETHEDI